VSAVDRVTAVLHGAGLTPEIRRFPEGTHTAVQAAAAVGCELGQICKSLMFRR
jgi:prolyl-tRNA editing enzyme YbaK/EbsC (Cys-tRNA(Pro) deacylase)